MIKKSGSKLLASIILSAAMIAQTIMPVAAAELPSVEPTEPATEIETETETSSEDPGTGYIDIIDVDPVITGFVMDEEAKTIQLDEKLPLSEVLELIGNEIQVYMEGMDEPQTITVSYACIEDYENDDLQVYHFEPVFDGYKFAPEVDGNPIITVEIGELEEECEFPLSYRDFEGDNVLPIESVMDDADYAGPAVDELGVPASFNPIGQLPAIKNQGSYGTCYAFSVMALADCQMLRKYGKTYDESEAQFAYFNWHPVSDPLGGITPDVNQKGDGSVWYDGGNTVFSQRVLANWVGAAPESAAPYTSMSSFARNGMDRNLSMGANNLHLQNVKIYKFTNDSDVPLIKQAIMNYGAVSVSYFESSSYFNSSTNSFYNGSTTSTNHAVSLVGWDDNYPASNFRTRPAGNGAWLLRNSWGGPNDRYSHNGYFWISYYDKSLRGTSSSTSGRAYAFDFEDASNYKFNYQYDGACDDNYISGSGSVTGANEFVAQTADPLRAVSFATDSVNVTYNVKVYVNCNTSNPETGSLVANQSGVTDAAGYYTIKLNTPVGLAAGTRFSVVVTLSKSSGYVYLQTEDSTPSSWWYYCQAKASAGQSFRKSGSTWQDYGSRYNRNIRIKAFTGGAGSDPSMPFIDVPAGSYFYDAVKWAVSKGITTGTSAITFSPANSCSRGQVVTFLHRAAGSPAPASSSNPFADIKSSDYFYTPVLWAVGKGVTTGAGGNLFKPSGTVNRAQVVTFLWRAKGQPAAPASGKFVDVPAGTYFSKAVDWAVSKGITTGNSATTFNPAGACNRGQVVTFLYRAYK